MTAPKYKAWDPNAICDNCGFKFKMSQLREQYVANIKIGMYCVPNNCWSPVHPNDFPMIVIPDGKPIRNARPEPADEFIEMAKGLSIWGAAWNSLEYGVRPDPIWDELIDDWDNY